jgi:hypothetical protein
MTHYAAGQLLRGDYLPAARRIPIRRTGLQGQ